MMWAFFFISEGATFLNADSEDFGQTVQMHRLMQVFVWRIYQKVRFLTLRLHSENTPIQIYWKFHLQKLKKFQIKILVFFIILLKT